MGFGRAARGLVELGEGKRGAQLEAAGLLPLRDSDGGEEGGFGRGGVGGVLFDEDFAANAMRPGVEPMLSGLARQRDRFAESVKGGFQVSPLGFDLREQRSIKRKTVFVALTSVFRQRLSKLGRADLSIAELRARPSQRQRSINQILRRPGRVLSRDQLMKLAYGREAEAYDRSVDMQIVRLRRKVEPESKRPTLIVTVAGSGYKFAAAVREIERGRAPEPPPRATYSVDEREGRGPERRYVAALAAELVPAKGGRMPSDPEDLSAIVAAFRGHAATVLTKYGGVIGERRGCEIVAYFGFPHAQENDGERAVLAALAMQRALAGLNAATGAPEFAARIGLESGRVVVDSSGEVYGEAPNVAARVQSAAAPGEIWITRAVHRQVGGLFVAEDKGERELTGVPEKMQLYRIVRVSGAAGVAARTRRRRWSAAARSSTS